MKLDGGVRSGVVATSVVRTCDALRGPVQDLLDDLMTRVGVRPDLHARGRPVRTERPSPETGPADRLTLGLCSGLANVGGLGPLRALGHLELDLIAFGQAANCVGNDGRRQERPARPNQTSGEQLGPSRSRVPRY